MLTDYALAALSVFFALRLFRLPHRTSVHLWAWGFLIEAAAAAAGGTFHGFTPYISESTRRGLWNLTMGLIGFGGGFMVSGSLAAAIKRGNESARWMLAGLLVTLLGFAIQQTGINIHKDFNHNDLFHCVVMGALYLFYRGARLLADRG